MPVIDLPFENLVVGAPKVLRTGMTGTVMFVTPIPEYTDRAMIIELSSTTRVMGAWVIKKGHAYRIGPNRVTCLPLIENDPDPIRRFCRTNALPLTMITYVKRGEEVYFGQAQGQGEKNTLSIGPEEPRVCLKKLWTTGNPALVFKILVVKDEAPKTYAELCGILESWLEIKDGTYIL